MRLKKIVSMTVGLVLASGSFAFVGCGGDTAAPPAADPVIDTTDDNYRSFYQIFVGSFSDSNGDGVGDIRGIINRLDYLNDGNVDSETSLGVQGIWLSPIFQSPSYHKYDAIDYYKVDSRFGTQADLEELIDLCHARNVKVILDLAINHTSSQSKWFTEFKNAHANGDTDGRYYDFYSYSTSAKSGYEKISGTDEYYECNFSPDMPELNYDNAEVRDKMVDVAEYWLNVGVDGFRFDAIKYIYFDSNTRSVEFWEWYMAELRKIKPDIYCVGECWSSDSEILTYYGALNCFSFDSAQMNGMITRAARSFSGGTDVRFFTRYVEEMQDNIEAKNPDGMYAPFIANHDTDRAAGYLPVDTGDMYAAANLYLLCCGTPFIYYGEEIGMKGIRRGGENTDANRRLAMLWGDGDTVRDPEGATYDKSMQIYGTVKSQIRSSGSLLSHYRKALRLRKKYPEIARGDYTAVDPAEKCSGFMIEYKGEKTLLLHNTSTDSVTVDISSLLTEVDTVADWIGLGKATLSGGTLTLGKQTSVIIKKAVA